MYYADDNSEGFEMTYGKTPPYKIGQRVMILCGPYKYSLATIIKFSDAFPRQLLSVKAPDGETLLYDWHEVKPTEDKVEREPWT